MSMTNDLYWVSVLGYIVITLTILIRERKYIYHNEKVGRAFMPLVCISLTFFVVDFFWGLCLVKAIRSDAVYYASSALLHVLAVVTTLSWLCYVLQYIRFSAGIVTSFNSYRLFYCSPRWCWSSPTSSVRFCSASSTASTCVASMPLSQRSTSTRCLRWCC